MLNNRKNSEPDHELFEDHEELQIVELEDVFDTDLQKYIDYANAENCLNEIF